jgi:hypothetical protein
VKGLQRLENWIEQVVEEPFVRLFAGQVLPQEVAARLVRAMEDGERLAADGVPEVPGRYRIALNPRDLRALQRHHPHLAEELTEALLHLVARLPIRMAQQPAVLLQADAALPSREVRITPIDGRGGMEQPTRDMDLSRVAELMEGTEAPSRTAYLIVEGQRVFDLAEPTVQVGRARDNDLVLDDPRVSRHHARLHRRFDRYVLRDLGSSGGTTVNGFPVQEVVLRTGDLVSLAGVDLIYAEERASRHGSDPKTDTQPYSPRGD